MVGMLTLSPQTRLRCTLALLRFARPRLRLKRQLLTFTGFAHRYIEGNSHTHFLDQISTSFAHFNVLAREMRKMWAVSLRKHTTKYKRDIKKVAVRRATKLQSAGCS